MPSYSSDGRGLLEVRDEQGRIVFNRVLNISVPGWSKSPQISAKFRDVDETSGHGKTKE